MIAPLLPPQSQDLYLALRALNLELVRLPDTASNATISAMRYAFWNDSITRTLDTNPPHQPLCILLSAALDRIRTRPDGQRTLQGLRFWIMRFLKARHEGLSNRPFPSLEAVEKRAEHTYSSLLYCVLASMPLNNMHVDHLASHIGKLAGIVALIRGVAVLASPVANQIHTPHGIQASGKKQVLLLPLNIQAKHRVRAEDVFRQGPLADGFVAALVEVAVRANDHLITVRTMLERLRQGQDAGHAFEHVEDSGHHYRGLESQAKGDAVKADIERGFPVFLETVPLNLYLQTLLRVHFDPWRIGPSWRLPFKLWWARKTRKI